MEEVTDDSDRPWYYERLMDLDHEGWVTVSIEDYLAEDEQLASERIIYVDYVVELAQELLERTAFLGASIDERFDKLSDVWQEELRDPMNAERIFDEYQTWAKEWRPWELTLNSSRAEWIEAGEEELHASLLARFDALDGSTLPATLVLVALLAYPDESEEIEDALTLLEEDEQRQMLTIRKSANLLQNAGFDVGDVELLPIIEGLDWIARLHELHDLHEDLRLLIVEQIAPFDSQLAQHHERRRMELVSQSDKANILEFKLQINSIADNLHQRLATLNDLLNSWRNDGVIFPHEDGIRPEELLEWETNLPEIEGTILIHLRALQRWKIVAKLWPDEVESSRKMAGVLELTERFVDHVEELDLRWKQYELEGMRFIEHYEGLGLVMDGWNDIIHADPRNAVQLLKDSEHLLEARAQLIQQFLSLDTSFEGGDKVEGRIQLLKEIEVGLEVIEDSHILLDTLARRGARHRRMLESDWMDLVSQGKASDSVATSNFTLAQFEHELATIRRFGTSNESTPSGGSVVAGEIHGRLYTRIHQELVVLESCGWSVDVLLSELNENVVATARKINAFRAEVVSYPKLVRRFAPLPWERDVSLAIEVQEQMRDPTQLRSLYEKIPSFIQRLSQRPVEDENFVLIPWSPTKPRPTLLPVPEHNVRQTMVPKDALEDAHEAMLEAMEVKPEMQIVAPASAELKISDKSAEKVAMVPKKETVEILEKTHDSAVVIPVKTQLREAKNTKDVEENVLDDIVLFLQAMNLDGSATALAKQGSAALPSVRRELAQHVGVAPRDTRIDRILRLSLRLMPQNDEHDGVRAKLLAGLGANMKSLKRWMRIRLEHRHSGSTDRFLEDAANLGKALKRIPGPGVFLPLTPDTYELPSSNDIQGLEHEVKQLLLHINLSNAGGVTA